MIKPDIDRIFDLQRMLLAFSQIERVIDRKHKGRYIRESDTEHSYNLAMTAWFLAPYFPDLDKNQLILYALAHDIVEVHAGDTFVYGDPEHLATKADREAAALEQLQEEWQDFPDLIKTIHDYEQRKTEEAKFIYALDKIMPIFTIYLSDGRTWKNEKITVDMLYEAKHNKVAVSKDILPYFDALYELLLKSPDVINRS